MASNSYTFEANPRVVKNKSKYHQWSVNQSQEGSDNGQNNFNIMYNKKIFRGNTHAMHLVKKAAAATGAPPTILSPQEKDNARVNQEKAKKKVEMIKEQLVAFSKNRSKQTPYDLRPGPPARIQVDLQPFLTEQITQPIIENQEEIQCDEFLEKPPSPKYVPKKRGKDNCTQVEDYDLFDYDREVQPILNVLINKTLEQAVLEVQEDVEISQIREFKKRYAHRRAQDRDEWALRVKEEIKLLKEKNMLRERARKIKQQQQKTLAKVQELNISKQYLRGLFGNVVMFLNNHSFWRDHRRDKLCVEYREYLQQHVEKQLVKSNISNQIIQEMFDNITKNIYEVRQKIEFQREIAATEKMKRRMIQNPERRYVYFYFKNNLVSFMQTEFSRRLDLFLRGSLLEWEQSHAARVTQIQEKIDGGAQYQDPKDVPITQDTVIPSPVPLINIQKMNGVAITVTTNPFFPVADDMHYFTPFLVLYDRRGTCIGMVGEEYGNLWEGVKFETNLRDRKLRLNDDEKVSVDFSKLPNQVNSIIFVVGLRRKWMSTDENGEEKENPLRTHGVKQQDVKYAKCRLIEEQTGQQFYSEDLIPAFGGGNMPPQVLSVAGNPDDGGEAGEQAKEIGEQFLIVGRIFKHQYEDRKRSITPNSASVPSPGPGKIDLAVDPVLQSSFVMQTPSYVAGLIPPRAHANELINNITAINPDEAAGEAEISQPAGASQQTLSVPTLSTVRQVQNRGWYFEGIRHKLQGEAPPPLPQIGLPGEPVPPQNQPKQAKSNPNWFEQIGGLTSRILLTPMPIWGKMNDDENSAIGGKKKGKGKKGAADKKKDKKKGKKGSDIPQTPIQDTSIAPFESMPVQDDQYTKFMKIISNIPNAALGPFDLDCTIDAPNKLQQDAGQSFIASVHASIEQDEAAHDQFKQLVNNLFEEAAKGGQYDQLSAMSEYGWIININNKILKRGKQVLKHGFDMMRLLVTPIAPKLPVVEKEPDLLDKDKAQNLDDDDGDDEEEEEE